jgi:hypothetical protein
MSLEDIQERLKSIFPINVQNKFVEKIEEEGEEDTEDEATDEEGGDDLFADEEGGDEETTDDESDAETDEEGGDEDEETDAEEDPSEDEPPADEAGLTAEQKIEKLFKDTGNPSHDWNLASEENQRLATFKFKVIGVDHESLMTEQEKAEGVPSNVLEQRLTTDEMVVYRDTVSELREKYPLIAQREKNLILWNASIPIYAENDKGESVNVYKDKNTINDAFEKIDEYLKNKYEESWQDNEDAINFVRNVKINFATEKSKITPHLITNKNLRELSENDLVSFNVVSSDAPDSVLNFIRDNLENEQFNKSPVFNTLSSDFSEDGSISRGSVYPIIRGTVTEEGATEGEGGDEGAEGGDFGGGADFGGGDEGGFGEGGPDLGGDEGGEDLGDEGGDTGEDTGGEDDEGLF